MDWKKESRTKKINCSFHFIVQNGILEKEAEVKDVREELSVLLGKEKELKSSKMDVDQKISALKSHIQDKKKSIQLNTDKVLED